MKILQINSVCGFGSTGRIAVQIQKAVENNGGEGVIAFGRGEAPDGVNSYKINSDIDVKLHGAFSRITDRQGFYSKGATRRLVSFIKEYNPDVIHLHNIHGYYLNAKILFNFLAEYGKPVVWTLHDCWAFTGHCSYFSYEGCDKWKSGCYSCPLKNEYPASLLMDNSKKNYDEKKQLFTALKNAVIVTPSKWLGGIVKESFLGKFPVKVIYNGVDLDCFKPTEGDFKEKYGIEDKKIVLGVASVWEKRKGLNDFFKLNKIIDDEYKIVLVGLNDAQISELPEGIIGIKRTSSARELAEIYTAADVFVNTTYEDNYPTTNLEALSCGTPVVTYNTGGSPESVAEGNGFTVPQGDVNAIAEFLPKAVELKVVTNGEFSASIKYEEYVSLYKEIISNSN
ncbi:MAG: glycosyltransferase [Candidatus Fimenecus sp.]